MRTAILVSALSIGLAACGTTGGLTPAAVTTDLTTIETDIIGYAQSLCGFQPALSTVESIITTLYPAASVATVPEQAIAQTICSAVPPPPTVVPAAAGRFGAAVVYYPGTYIQIHGTYVSLPVAARYHRHYHH
jgi:hypothetical protein